MKVAGMKATNMGEPDEKFVRKLVRRHNALLEFYNAAQLLSSFGRYDSNQEASGLEKEVLDRINARYDKARSEVIKILEEK